MRAAHNMGSSHEFIGPVAGPLEAPVGMSISTRASLRLTRAACEGERTRARRPRLKRMFSLIIKTWSIFFVASLGRLREVGRPPAATRAAIDAK
jgi:hypothetical protein